MSDLVEEWDQLSDDRVKTYRVLADVDAERRRQDAKWGREQSHPSGTDAMAWGPLRDDWQRVNSDNAAHWTNILAEEVFEAFAEEATDTELEAELIQVAAVAVAWVEDIRRRRESNA